MRAEFSKVATTSHCSLTNINCEQQIDERFTSSIYRGGELLLLNYGITAKKYRDKLKIGPFSSQLFNNKKKIVK